ncbi:uncharacterized protein LOC144100333 [Amblyomma americanum]
MAPFLLVLALLTPTAFAATPTCLNITLPGILNLGTCFGTSLSLCSSPVTGIVTALTKLVTCLITALTSTSVAGAIAALFQIISLVLNLAGFGFLIPFVNLVLLPLCVITGTAGCTTLLNANATCTAPISITLPDTLNIGRCVNQTLLLCQNGAIATDRLVMNLINTVTCLLTTLLGTNPGTLLNGLGCAVAALFQPIPFVNIVSFLLRGALNCP